MRSSKFFLFSVSMPLIFVAVFMIQCVTSTDTKDSSKKTSEKSEEKAEEQVARALTAEEEKKVDELRAEMELGRNMAGRLLHFYGVYDNPEVIGYLNTVGRLVASYSDFPDRRYMIAILDSDTVNAFACPGGYILVTMGAVRNAVNEAEIAMVLGHEVAHVGKQHMLNTLKGMSKADLDKAAEEVEKRKDLPEAVLVRQRPDPEENVIGNMLAKYLSGGSGGSFSIIKAASAGMGFILEKGLDHKLEFEADHEGVKYAVRAGYEPKGLLKFLERIEANTPKEKRKILSSTHPRISERVKKIEEVLKMLEADEITGARGKKRFMRYHAMLPDNQGKKSKQLKK